MERLNALDEQRYLSACEEERTTTQAIKALARFMLAEKLRDADSISALTEQKLTSDNH